MKNISVVVHSGYGHTTNQANAITSGIESVGDVAARLIEVLSGNLVVSAGQNSTWITFAARTDTKYAAYHGQEKKYTE